MVSGYLRGVNDIFFLLVCYAEYIDSYLRWCLVALVSGQPKDAMNHQQLTANLLCVASQEREGIIYTAEDCLALKISHLTYPVPNTDNVQKFVEQTTYLYQS